MLNDMTHSLIPVQDQSEVAEVLRHCATCGLCTATCPTYVLTNDDKDSPRGRNKLIREMICSGEAPTAEQVKYIDHCLSCLSCMTTCPSGVDYMHLIDQARIYIENYHQRPRGERALRNILAWSIPSPLLFSLSMKLAQIARPLQSMLPDSMQPMLKLLPEKTVNLTRGVKPGSYREASQPVKRVALLTGCAQQVLEPEINVATLRLLQRFECEIIVPPGSGCCGALSYHMGKEAPALEQARANVKAWYDELQTNGLDAIIINASGCGTTVKDYAHMLKDDPQWAEPAQTIAALAMDITEFLQHLPLQPTLSTAANFRVAYHSACSMQHGQQIRELPKQLLRSVGFNVVAVPEGHLCCGSAGTYNIFQSDISEQLRDRKVRRIQEVTPDIVATGNIGCMVQIGPALDIPVVHSVALIDWATGGPQPVALKQKGEGL